MNQRILHVGTFIVTLLLCILTIRHYPTLNESRLIEFSIVSGYLTLYGVMVAIIEVIKTKSAAEEANKRAAAVFKKMDDLYGLRDITTCLSAIEMAIDSVNRGEHISASSLMTISKVYCSVFHEEIANENSEHRKNNSLLNSFSHAAESSSIRNKTKLKKTLLSMSSQLAHVAGQKTSKDILENES